jgi:hypothetical protein
MGFTEIKILRAGAKPGTASTMPNASAPAAWASGYTMAGGPGPGWISVHDADSSRFERIVGESAMTGNYAFESKAADWVLGPDYLAMMLMAICSIIPDKDIVINTLVTGLPASDVAALGKSLAARLMKRHVCVVGSAERTMTIRKVIVPSQPYCALADLAMKEDGTSKKNDFSNGRVVICDLGGKTLHVQASMAMDLGNQPNFARDFGLLPEMEEIMAEIRRQYSLSPSIAEISTWLRQGWFLVRGKRVSIATLAAPHLFKLIGVAVGVLSRVSNSAAYSQVALVGGGSAALSSLVDGDGVPEFHKQIIERGFVKPVLPANPALCVASGAAKIAAYIVRKERGNGGNVHD